MTTIINKEEAMLAITKDGCALEYVSDEMRADKQVVMCAWVNGLFFIIQLNK